MVSQVIRNPVWSFLPGWCSFAAALAVCLAVVVGAAHAHPVPTHGNTDHGSAESAPHGHAQVGSCAVDLAGCQVLPAALPAAVARRIAFARSRIRVARATGLRALADPEPRAPIPISSVE